MGGGGPQPATSAIATVPAQMTGNPITFQIAVGATATQLTASTTAYPNGWVLENRSDSTASFFWGGPSVTTGGATPGVVTGATTAGVEVLPGGQVVFPPGSPSQVWVIAASAATAVACVGGIS